MLPLRVFACQTSLIIKRANNLGCDDLRFVTSQLIPVRKRRIVAESGFTLACNTPVGGSELVEISFWFWNAGIILTAAFRILDSSGVRAQTPGIEPKLAAAASGLIRVGQRFVLFRSVAIA